MALTKDQKLIKELQTQLESANRVIGNQQEVIKDLRDSTNPRTTAEAILQHGVHMLRKNAKARDSEETGERSMARCVQAFNVLTGQELTETQGWQFMQCLKLARATTPGAPHNADDFIDGAAYAGLACESNLQERGRDAEAGSTERVLGQAGSLLQTR